MSVTSPPRQLTVELPHGVRQVVLRFHGVRHAGDSFAVRVMARDPGSGGLLRAGTFYMYGHGEAAARPLQTDAAGGTKHLEPFDTLVDLSPTARRLAGGALELSLVVTDLDGQPLPDELFRFDRMELEIR